MQIIDFLDEISSYNAFVKRYFLRRNVGNERMKKNIVITD